MTPSPGPAAAQRQPQAANQQRPGLFGGLGGSLMRGIFIGGLIGMLLGYGFGGMAGALGFLLQLLLVGMLVWLALAFFRSRNTAAAGGAPSPSAGGFGGPDPLRRDADATPGRAGGFKIPPIGGGASQAVAPQTEDITPDQADLDTLQRLLGEVQAAFGREDHAALRRLSTPEMVSFFSEELADNAQRGVRNEVSDVHLVEADIAEAWREGDTDYATAAFRYEAVDVLRDRATGAIVEGEDALTEVVELWTFVRQRGGDWKLSAIQEA
jgi:predicted lipid-binding transport protein (Tim44 family)